MSGPSGTAGGAEGPTALFDAIFSGNEAAVRSLLRPGMAHPRTPTGQVDPLGYAITCSNTNIIEYILSLEPDVNARDTNGVTPLMRAAIRNDTTTIAALLDRKAEIDAADQSGRTALDHAVEKLAGEAANLLRARGSQTQSKAEELLRLAAASGDAAQVLELLARGARADTCDRDRVSALMLAASRGHVDVVATLLKAGANVNAQDTWQRSALYRACGEGRVEVVRMLLECGADPNAADHLGHTGLFEAERRGDGEIVSMLLAAGAEPVEDLPPAASGAHGAPAD